MILLSYEKWNDSDCIIAKIMMISNTSLSCFHSKKSFNYLMEYLMIKTDPRVTKCWAFFTFQKQNQYTNDNTLVVSHKLYYLFRKAKNFNFFYKKWPPRKKFVKRNWGIFRILWFFFLKMESSNFVNYLAQGYM